jgi:Zn-dependent protease
MYLTTTVQAILQYPALLLALCVHEFAHAATAAWLGDRTAADQGRLSLNPLVHIDPVGTVLLPLLGLLTGFPLFGWAKPVPVQAANFRRGWFSKGQVLVAAAGPLSNLLQALGWVGAYALLTRFVDFQEARQTPLFLAALFIRFSILINLILAAFNMLPIPPLDGAWIASWGMPRHLGERFDRFMEPYGFVLLLLCLPFLRFLLAPVLSFGDFLVRTVGAW